MKPNRRNRRRREAEHRAANQQKQPAILSAAAPGGMVSDAVRTAAPDAGKGKAELPADLPLVAVAVRERWPIPAGRRGEIAVAMCDLAATKAVSPFGIKDQIAAARVVVSMDKVNLAVEELELKRKELDTRLNDELDQPALDPDDENAILEARARRQQPGGTGDGGEQGPLATGAPPPLPQ